MVVLVGTACNAFADGTSCQNLTDMLGNATGVAYVSRSNGNGVSKTPSSGTAVNMALRYLETKNTFAVNYSGVGVLIGHARCSSDTDGGTVNGVWPADGSVTPENVTALDDVTDQTGSSSGTKCYCHAEYFFGADGASFEISSKWVYRTTETSSTCTSSCANYCALSMKDSGTNHMKYREAVLLNSDSVCGGVTCATGYHGLAASNVPSSIVSASATKYAYITNSNTTGVSPSGTDINDYNLTAANSFAVDFGNDGVLTGYGRCSSRRGFTNDTSTPSSATYTWENPIRFYELTDETGVTSANYCYCKLTGYSVDGDYQDISGMWVYRNGFSGGSDCGNRCAQECANRMKGGNNYTAFKTALLNGLQSCAANSINIVWSDVPAEYVTSVVTYGGNIETPPTYIPRADGKRFLGWTLSTTPPAPVND